MAATKDISVRAGDTWNGYTIVYNLNGSPVDITDHLIEMHVKSAANELLLDLSVGSGITKLDSVNGQFRIDPLIVPDSRGQHEYDLQFTDAGGIVKTYMKGSFKIEKHVTI